MALLIGCLVVVLVMALCLYLIDLLPVLDPPIKNILKVIVILLGILWIVQRSGLLA